MLWPRRAEMKPSPAASSKRKPVATKRELLREAAKWQRLMFYLPCRIGVFWHNSLNGDYVDLDDKDCYAGTVPYPQYFYGELHLDPVHEGWWRKEDGEISECLRHEMGHFVVAPVTQFALHLIDEFCADEKARAVLKKELNDREDEVVEAVTHMPVWGKMR